MDSMKFLTLLVTLSALMVSPSTGDEEKQKQKTGVQNSTVPAALPAEARNFYPFYQRAERMGGLMRFSPTLPDLVMYGLAGIPIWRAFQYVAPFLLKRGQNANSGKKKPKRDSVSHSVSHRRTRRDLAYVKELLELLLAVERNLEEQGVTEPQCQLKATCEIYRRGGNDIDSVSSRNFVKLVNEMRREIQNPRIEPLAKYVYEYYEEAAIRGEKRCDCRELYPDCTQSLDNPNRNKKGRIKQRPINPYYRYLN